METSRPRLLDLYCGAGGAGMGYHRAGFEVVGVDVRPQPRYPFRFWQTDVLKLEPWALGAFDAVHASPPGQLFSAYQRANKRQGQHLNLIPETRQRLRAAGRPYVIENVPGAPLEQPATICGVSSGLEVRRHRLFETSFAMMVPPCACGGWMPAKFDHGSRHIRPNDRRTVAVGEWRIPLDVQRRAMGIEWMEVAELSQAVPPAYTELIGQQLMGQLQ